MNFDFPPEAFTKKTLQKAFSWLQEQPKEVRQTIHTPERLVSLYQKSQRLKDSEALLKPEKFIRELKKLTIDKNSNSQVGLVEPKTFKEEKKSISTEETHNSNQSQKIKENPIGENNQTCPGRIEPGLLDPLSKNRIDRVMKRLNLSSPEEALRILISLGFEKLSEI